MIEAISCGITDYLPRDVSSFGQLVDTILDERDRLKRWQYVILSDKLGRRAINNDKSSFAESPNQEETT
jgi:hypothetical protein